jgi:predicted flap endonuclease-1-like 5' DNA nuclease
MNMSHASEYIDPRSNVSHPIESGQVYTDARTGEELVLVFESEDAVLLRDENTNHRLEPRDDFEAHVGGNRYTLQADESDTMASSTAVRSIQSLLDRYEYQDGRTAAHKVEALEEALDLIEHGGQPDDNETVDFESIGGIGEAAAGSLRSHGFSVKKDIRQATREEIVDVPNMGAKNTDNLLEAIA